MTYAQDSFYIHYHLWRFVIIYRITFVQNALTELVSFQCLNAFHQEIKKNIYTESLLK